MKRVKMTGDHRILQKRSGRFAVQDKNKRFLHGDDKTKVLLAAGFVTVPEPKQKAAEAEEGSAS
jgi:hypothetical protein